MARSKSKERAKPHSKKKQAEENRRAVDPDQVWADEIIARLVADYHPWQQDASEDPSVRISLLWGRGVGKTSILRARALIKMLRIKGAIVAYIATSRPTARKLNWNPLKRTIFELGITEFFEFHETRMECTCTRTGSVYQFIGADDTSEVEKLRGQPFNEVQVDECASHDKELLEYMLDECVAPRLGERNGVIVLAGTPGHVLRGLFYDATHPGSEFHRDYRKRHEERAEDWIGWSSHSCELMDIVNLPDAKRYPAMLANWAAALVEKKFHNWSDDNPKWLREYRRRWASNSQLKMYQYRAKLEDGTLWNQWDPFGGKKLEGVEAIRAAIAALPKEFDDWLYGYGQDLGGRDPYALNVFAFSPSDPLRRKWHVFSFDRKPMYSRKISEMLIGVEATAIAFRSEVYTEVGGLFGVTEWPVAIVADLAALGENIIVELQEVYGIKIKAAEKKDKKGNVELLNGDLVDGIMFILAGSELEEQLDTLQWKLDEYGNFIEDKGARNDHADSAIYIRVEIGNLFSGGASEEDKKKAEAAKVRSKQQKPAAKAPKKDEWSEQPVRSRGTGEFDSLLDQGGFPDTDGWGND